MLGEQIAETSGQVTGRRVLPSAGGGPKVETSFQTTGKLLGVEISELGTYASSMRPDGSVYGEGQGIIMGKGGEAATWVGGGVGTLKRDGAVSYRGAVYSQTATPAWSRLNIVVGVFEFEVDAQGHARAKLWEWK
jgi:hypothetical protein